MEREQECLIHIFIGMNHHPYRFHLKIFTYDKQPMNKHNPNSSEKPKKMNENDEKLKITM